MKVNSWGEVVPENRDEALIVIARWVARQAERAYRENPGTSNERDMAETDEARRILSDITLRKDEVQP